MNKILEDIWFTKKEAIIYLAWIWLYNPTAISLSKKTGINRTTLYGIIEWLKQKWLISKWIIKNNTFFKFLPPEEIIHYLDRNKREINNDIEKKKNIIENNLSALRSIKNSYITKPKVVFYEWKKAMREAYEDTLSSSDDIKAYANVETVHEALPDFFPEYYIRRKNAWIWIKAIMPNNEKSILRKEKDSIELREIKLIDKDKYLFTPEINIYDNKILITSWLEEMSIMIESKEISECFKKIHNLTWDLLKK